MEHDPRFPIPPGYAPWGEQGMVLIDPPCAAGHPLRTPWQRPWSPCAEHGGHPGWRCGCGVETWLFVVDGRATYVTDLPCYRAERMPPL